jgi:hypothetical protein
MRLVATECLSFDGVLEKPGRWSGPFFQRRSAQFQVGRATGEGCIAAICIGSCSTRSSSGPAGALFAEGLAKRALDLTDTKRFVSGIVILEYRPNRP